MRSLLTRINVVVLASTLMCGCASTQAQTETLPGGAEQIVLVLTQSWDATQGLLFTYDLRRGHWQQSMHDIPVSIGRAGSAWGIGLHEAQSGVQKLEGDGRSPAGMFTIGTAFGYAGSVMSGIDYRPMNEFDYCIDVNESPLYNKIVDARKVGQSAVAQSTEPMRRDIHLKDDQRYRLGFVVEHNPQNVSTRGSCIFAHLWGSKGQTTAGCTAMDDTRMQDLLAWLRSDKQPVFVLLPMPEYLRLQTSWNLPRGARAP